MLFRLLYYSSSSNDDHILKECHGYLDLNNCTKCTQKTSKSLYIIRNNTKLYYCKGSHIMRYIVEQYGKQGAINNHPKKSRKSNDEKSSQDGMI